MAGEGDGRDGVGNGPRRDNPLWLSLDLSIAFAFAGAVPEPPVGG